MSRIEHRLLTSVARASADFGLLEPNDRVLVAVSGGKDSHALLYLLREISRRTPFPFSLFALNVDQGHPGFPKRVLPEYFEREGYEYRIIEEDTYSVVKEKIPAGKTTCSLCSRLRRGILYTAAAEMGATKIALGHHRDDVIETLLLNIFYSGQMKAMPPRLRSDDGRNIVIRPLVYAAEPDLAAFADESRFRSFPAIFAARKRTSSESASRTCSRPSRPKTPTCAAAFSPRSPTFARRTFSTRNYEQRRAPKRRSRAKKS